MNDIREKLKAFKGLILDADGVWFSGHEYRAVAGGTVLSFKSRSYQDSQGLSFLRSLPIKIVFATGENEPIPSLVEKFNNEASCKSGAWAPIEYFTDELKAGGKVESLEAWLGKHNLSWEECVYVGDDVTDYAAMEKAGLRVAPANATRVIKKIADLILTKDGGAGALRELAEMILDARGIDEKDLPFT